VATNKPAISSDGALLGGFDLHLKSAQLDWTVPAQFFLNYQKEQSVWAEIVPERPILAGMEVSVSAPSNLEPFSGLLGGLTMTQAGGALSLSATVVPLITPLESVPKKNLKELTFALLDSPITGDLISEQSAKNVTLACGPFDVNITEPTKAHLAVAQALGSSPHRLSNSGTITERNGQRFNSKNVRVALDTLHDALSFAAGRWVGITMAQAGGAQPIPDWFRWGTSRMSGTENQPGWYDPQHAEWLLPLCNAFLKLKSNEEMWEPVRASLYWYFRSNTRDAGIDSSLILSQCALELLSWFVIVKVTSALSEDGYSQLGSASEKLRLTLTLLGIPRQIPAGLKVLFARRKEWKDVTECLVQARNYLVHPTQSRSGKRRAQREYPFYELWLASQWLLELVILRLLGYSGSYRNRTRWKEFNPIEPVPWA
jgi:hypothetical protein